MNIPHARQLLAHLFSDQIGRYLELTYITPAGVQVSGPRVWSESYRIGTDRLNYDRIDAYNRDGYSVFYGLLPKVAPLQDKFTRANENDAACVQCLWVDIDEKGGTPKREAYSSLVHHAPPPTVIIDSGGGLHGIWRIVPQTITPDSKRAIKGIMSNMARAFNGDKVGDLARVFRLPGTINTKTDRNGAECRIIGKPRDVLYELGWFKDYLPSAQPARQRREPAATPPDGIPAYIRWYLSTPHSEGNRNKALYWTARCMLDDALSIGDALSLLTTHAASSGLTQNEIERTITSAFNPKS